MAAEDPEPPEDPKKRKAREFLEKNRGRNKSTPSSRDKPRREGKLKKGHR